VPFSRNMLAKFLALPEPLGTRCQIHGS
jgi:hypothetical protein